MHTGQHYDDNMSRIFFRDLGLRDPDVSLEIGSGTHAEQTAKAMMGLDPVLRSQRFDWVVVYGDVNSTLAAAVVAAKLMIPVAHVEAGLRSFDRSMPEELNRLLTDQVADLLLTPSADADANLAREGIPPERIERVGNVMIDTLGRALPATDQVQRQHPHDYALVTLHRPSNVDHADRLRLILDVLSRIAQRIPVIFPVHPRTRRRIAELGEPIRSGALQLTDPVGYVEFIALERAARVVITDSGGIQEETTYLGVPCLTLRPNTERPITVELGTNIVVGDDPRCLEHEVEVILSGGGKHGRIPPLWDGHAGGRIAEALINRRPQG